MNKMMVLMHAFCSREVGTAVVQINSNLFDNLPWFNVGNQSSSPLKRS